MAYTIPTTRTTGELVTASIWNVDVVENIKELRNSSIPRVTSVTSSAAPTPNASTDDAYSITALNGAAMFGAPTGSPVNFQRLIIRIKDNGVARLLGWNPVYVNGGVALPSVTVAGKRMHVLLLYDAVALQWLCIGSALEP